MLTALAVIGACAWPVWRGIDVIRYGIAGSKPDATLPWIAAPGLASTAREREMIPVDDFSDDKEIRQRRDELEQLLAIRPLSSFFWLKLAEIRIDAHEDWARSIDAFELSALTGPNEGHIMIQRGMFGIWQWETLSPEIKKRAITDLLAQRISDVGLAWMRTTLAEKAEQVRQEIRSQLQARGFSEGDLVRVGM